MYSSVEIPEKVDGKLIAADGIVDPNSEMTQANKLYLFVAVDYGTERLTCFRTARAIIRVPQYIEVTNATEQK
jgi:hypothetical protein